MTSRCKPTPVDGAPAERPRRTRRTAGAATETAALAAAPVAPPPPSIDVDALYEQANTAAARAGDYDQAIDKYTQIPFAGHGPRPTTSTR